MRTCIATDTYMHDFAERLVMEDQFLFFHFPRFQAAAQAQRLRVPSQWVWAKAAQREEHVGQPSDTSFGKSHFVSSVRSNLTE